MTDQVLIVDTSLPALPTSPAEGREWPVSPFVYADPEQVYAEPNWRTEPTTEMDPRKGR